MKRIILSVLMLVLAVPAWASVTEGEALQKDELFAGTDKFSQGAKEVTEVNLDKKMLAMMEKLGATDSTDKDQLDLARKMDFVYVRSYEYEKPGQYHAADLEVFRVRLEGADWSHVVKERSETEQADVWVRTDKDGNFSELVVISAEPTELNFVHLKGHMTPKELSEMGAKYGVPRSNDAKGQKGAK